MAEVVEAALRQALDFSSFDNMKTMEATGRFKSRKLLPGDRADPESFKVRQGKVGGYVNYLGPEDIAYMNQALSRLDARYGYGAGEAMAPRRSAG